CSIVPILPLTSQHPFPTRRSSDLGRDGLSRGLQLRGLQRRLPPAAPAHGGRAGKAIGEVDLRSDFEAQPSRTALRRRRGGSMKADRKSTRLNSSHLVISYAVCCLK